MAEPHWSDHAECRTDKAGSTPKERVDNFFFKLRDAPGRVSALEREAATRHYAFLKSICAACPVFSECERETIREPEGFYAGRTSRQRERYRKSKKKVA